MKHKIASNTPHTRLGKVNPFNDLSILTICVLVGLWLLSVPASALLDVEVTSRQQKQAGVELYTYFFNVTNNSEVRIEFFSLTYSGSKPLAHDEPSASWTYSEEESADEGGNVLLRKIDWRSASGGGGSDIVSGKSAGFQITVTERISGINWLVHGTDNPSTFVGPPAGSASGSFTFPDPKEPPLTFTSQVPLTLGINMVSLPLKPQQPFTASSLATTLGSTLVIRAEAGVFQVYVPAGAVGEDFPIEGGKGYIVNLTAARTFEITGQAWGAAPAAKPAEPWAFVVTGHIVDPLPVDATVSITNPHTGQILRLPVQANGTFVGAFVDIINQQAVVAPGERLRLELIDGRGQPLSELQYPQIVSTDIARAYMRTTLTASPQQARLLQNFPNPFNPETWIPYQLDQDAVISIQIYDAGGRLIRQLELGHQSVGFYTSSEKAAYWNGKNQYGEAVASGSYYVHLQAGSFHAVRKMVVLK